jgi:hypothetical protein
VIVLGAAGAHPQVIETPGISVIGVSPDRPARGQLVLIDENGVLHFWDRKNQAFFVINPEQPIRLNAYSS